MPWQGILELGESKEQQDCAVAPNAAECGEESKKKITRPLLVPLKTNLAEIRDTKPKAKRNQQENRDDEKRAVEVALEVRLRQDVQRFMGISECQPGLK